MAKTIKPHHEFMLVRPRPDIHQEFTTLSMKGGVIDTKLFGKIKTADLIKYNHSGIRNQFAFGEVLRMGKGLLSGPSKELPDVLPGTLVGFDLAQVAFEAPSNEVQPDGYKKDEYVYAVPFKAALCKFTVGEHLPKPLGNFILTEEDPVSMARFQFGGETKLVLPDTVLKAGVKTNNGRHTSVRMAVEKVLAKGPGRYIKGMFQEPEVDADEHVLFMSVLSVDFSAYSKRFRFTPWTQIMGSF